MQQIFTGCLPDLEDERDYKYSDICEASPIPTNDIDLRPQMPVIWSQVRQDCTANAVGASLAYQVRLRRGENFDPSRAYSYYMTRMIENKINQDSGASIRDACMSPRKYGICNTVAYPESNPINYEPRFTNLITAMRYKPSACYRLNGLSEIVDSLQKQIPVIIAVDFYKGFNNVGADGICRDALKWNTPISSTNHAMLIVGRLPSFVIDGVKTPVLIIRNSHGIQYGDKGYCYVPEQQLVNFNLGDTWAIFLDTVDADQPTKMDTPTVVQSGTIFSLIIDFCTAPEPAIAMRDFYNKNGFPSMINQFQSSMGLRWVVAVEAIFDSYEKAKIKQDEMLKRNLRNFIGII